MGKPPPKDPPTFVGIVGRESKKKDGKQGIHHHPQMSQLGNGVENGLKPGGFTGIQEEPGLQKP